MNSATATQATLEALNAYEGGDHTAAEQMWIAR